METVNLTPIKELTLDNVNQLVIHTTRSSIRRAAAVKPMVSYPATDKVPALYYVQEIDPETKEQSWSIHALSVEVSKFLLLKSIGEDTPTEAPTEAPTENQV